MSRSRRTRVSCSPARRRRPVRHWRRAVPSPRRLGAQIAGWFTPVGGARRRRGRRRRGVGVYRRRPARALHGADNPRDDGLHTVDVRGSNGYEATLLGAGRQPAADGRLDQPGATVPLNGQVPLTFRCGDTVLRRRVVHGDRGRRRREAGLRGADDAAKLDSQVRLTATDRVGRIHGPDVHVHRPDAARSSTRAPTRARATSISCRSTPARRRCRRG